VQASETPHPILRNVQRVILHRPALTQGSPLVRFAAAPLILRRLTFQGRYSPLERFQFMNCA
jgi:hypothetical protein